MIYSKFLPRYANAVYAAIVCSSVCLSVTSWYCIETTGRMELVFDNLFFQLFYTLCYKESRAPAKILIFGGALMRVHPSELCLRL